MSDNWWDEGIPKPSEDGDSSKISGSNEGFAWWQRTDKNGDSYPPRFYLKSGEKREVTFIDDKCFDVWEHRFWIDGRPGWATCVKKIRGSCPFCERGSKAYKAGFFSLIDHTGYTTKEGEEVKDYVSLLSAKHYTLQLLRNKYETHEGLAGHRFLVFRTTNKMAPTVGDDWNHVRHVDLPDDIKPIDYREILKPLSEDDMLEIARIGEWRGKKVLKPPTADSSFDYSSEDSIDYEEYDEPPF